MLRAKCRDLGDEAGREHRVEPRGDRLVQRRAIRRNERHRDRGPRAVACFARALQCGKRPARDLVHFERALDALRVHGLQASRRDGIDPRELRVERAPAFGRGPRVEARANRGVGRRQARKPLQQCLEIEHRSPDQQRNGISRSDGRHHAHCIGAKARGRICVDGIEDVDKVMGHPCARRGVGFRGSDVHSAIDLRRIHADDLDVEPLGERHGERRLAGARRPHQQHRRNLMCPHACG